MFGFLSVWLFARTEISYTRKIRLKFNVLYIVSCIVDRRYSGVKEKCKDDRKKKWKKSAMFYTLYSLYIRTVKIMYVLNEVF